MRKTPEFWTIHMFFSQGGPGKFCCWPNLPNFPCFFLTLRILGPSNGGVWTSIAGVFLGPQNWGVRILRAWDFHVSSPPPQKKKHYHPTLKFPPPPTRHLRRPWLGEARANTEPGLSTFSWHRCLVEIAMFFFVALEVGWKHIWPF